MSNNPNMNNNDEKAERKRAAWRRWRDANLEHCRAKDAEKSARYRAENPEKYRDKSTEASKKFREDNPTYHAEWQANARRDSAYAALAKVRQKASNKKHPATAKAGTHAKRGRKKAARGGGMTGVQWKEIILSQEGHCAICDLVTVELTPDHVVPLSKGGCHDVFNIVALCRSCNSRKHAKDPVVSAFQPWVRTFVKAAIKWHADNRVTV